MSTMEWGHYAPFASTSFSNFVQVARQCQLTPAKLDPVSSLNETRASMKEFPWRNRNTSPANFNPRTELCRGSVRGAIASNSTSQEWKTSAGKTVQRHCTRRFPTSAKSFIFLTIFFPVFFLDFLRETLFTGCLRVFCPLPVSLEKSELHEKIYVGHDAKG